MSGICRHPRAPQALALAGMPRGHGVTASAAVQRRPLPGHACQMARDAPRVSGQTSYRRSTGLRSFQITCRLDLSAPRHASRRPSRGRPEPWEHSTCQNLTPYQRCSNATHPLHFEMDSREEINGCFPRGSCSRTRRDKLRIPPSVPSRAEVGTPRLGLCRLSEHSCLPPRWLHLAQVINSSRGMPHRQYRRRGAP